ncbi:hypothetical protein IMY05_008G0009900 [Salix suchowensis]|nr:hypothetical protein IMY05_008G0009900 [Salix suchowensis]
MMRDTQYDLLFPRSPVDILVTKVNLPYQALEMCLVLLMSLHSLIPHDDGRKVGLFCNFVLSC